MKLNDKALWVGLALLVVLGFLFVQKKSVTLVPTPIVEKAKLLEKDKSASKIEKPDLTPEKKPDLATFKGMVKTEINTDDEIFCSRAAEKIFFLPRQVALQITKERKTQITLPKQYASCLKDGAWSFYVVEFDLSSRIPYRYYMKISLTIKNTVTLTPTQTRNVFQSQKDQLKKVYYNFDEKIGLVQFVIQNLTESNFAFHYTNTVENLYGSLRIEPTIPVGKIINAAELFKNEASMKNRYLPPSDNRMKQYESLLKPDLQAIYTDSKFDLSVHNLSALFYLKHKKKIDIVVKKMPEVVKPHVQSRLIQVRSLKRKIRSYFVVDVRPERMTKSLSLENSYPLNYKRYLSNSYFLLADYYTNFNERKLQSLQSIDQHIEKIVALAKEKPILLVGLGDEDPFVDYLVTKLPLEKTNSLKILKNGFYEAFHRSYFFGNFKFSANKKVVDVNEYDNVLTFLSLGH